MEGNNMEKKSTLIGVIVTILVIVGLMVGAYFLLNNKKDGDTNKNDQEVKEATNGWNGIYKKVDSNNQVLLYTKDGKVGSLMFAQEINIADKKELFYSIQFEEAMTIENGKMYKKDEEGTTFTIEKDGNIMTVTYNGDPVLADGYKEFVGTYNWVRNVTSSSLDEFKK